MAISPERLAQLRKELWGPRHQELIDEIDQLEQAIAAMAKHELWLEQGVDGLWSFRIDGGKWRRGDMDTALSVGRTSLVALARAATALQAWEDMGMEFDACGLSAVRLTLQRYRRELDEARELHDTAMTTLLAELGADTSEPRMKWVSLAIANLKHERNEARAVIDRLSLELADTQAACAAMMRVLRDVKVHGDDPDAAKWCRDALAQPNPGQALFEENAKLRAAINAMATDALWIAQIDEGPNTGAWQWILLYETDWHGAYPTPLEAALVGVERGAL